MKKLNLTYVSRKELVSKKTGKPFTSISIKAKEYGENFLSGFGNAENTNWKEGMEVEVVDVLIKPGQNGKQFYNFEMARVEPVNIRLKKIEVSLERLQSEMKQVVEHVRKMIPQKTATVAEKQAIMDAHTATEYLDGGMTPEEEASLEATLTDF